MIKSMLDILHQNLIGKTILVNRWIQKSDGKLAATIRDFKLDDSFEFDGKICCVIQSIEDDKPIFTPGVIHVKCRDLRTDEEYLLFVYLDHEMEFI